MNYINIKYCPKESWGESLSTQGAVTTAHRQQTSAGGTRGPRVPGAAAAASVGPLSVPLGPPIALKGKSEGALFETKN